MNTIATTLLLISQQLDLVKPTLLKLKEQAGETAQATVDGSYNFDLKLPEKKAPELID